MIFNFVGFVDFSSVEVFRRPVEPNTLNDSIKGVLQSITFLLLIGIQDTIFNFVKKPTSFRISQDYIYSVIPLFQVFRNASNRSSRACSTYKGINISICLLIYLRTCLLVMNVMVVDILELVHEEGSCRLRISIRQVVEMVRVDNRNWRNLPNVSTQDLKISILLIFRNLPCPKRGHQAGILSALSLWCVRSGLDWLLCFLSLPKLLILFIWMRILSRPTRPSSWLLCLCCFRKGSGISTWSVVK